ncbi:tRNA (guanine(46)-N(7))-methyltransferase TrmB [Parvularcula marina]|uniref:tRNA (guanine-N(7)-)-methyltransferase n=1 Tax=Parvularcula marina TaxID=2292771 RepID=A0A371RIY8_9PROT|nr:tRNA (guanine(46)-N(7))-methyltransferase TrmB [Parvularcula marina]RFB05394.1 tRNA (guanosine(46)-N7)-methyltransferase TrmB [Parvularcula marina]
MKPPEWDKDRLWGRHQAKKLRPRPQRLMEELLPRVEVTPETVFERTQAHGGPVWLEVGFGGGEHLAWQATHNPDVLLIGAEPFMNGVAKLLTQIEDEGQENIAVRYGDVKPLMTALPDKSLERLFVLHPDPWPKKRHFKRRMISLPFLKEAARLLKPGCELRVASDIPDYVRWTLMHVQMHNRQSADFEWTAECRADWTDRPEDWPQTRYEAKARREGRPPAYLRFTRT